MPIGSLLCPTVCVEARSPSCSKAIVELDLTDLAEIELPRGYGRD
jgi:hypothetical protein